MSPTMKDLGIDHLSVADRFSLMQEIWESIIENPEQIPLTDSQKHILDQRCAELNANPDDVLTWDQIKSRVRSRQ